MMTKLKLNVYRAEDEFITMQRLQCKFMFNTEKVYHSRQTVLCLAYKP